MPKYDLAFGCRPFQDGALLRSVFCMIRQRRSALFGQAVSTFPRHSSLFYNHKKVNLNLKNIDFQGNTDMLNWQQLRILTGHKRTKEEIPLHNWEQLNQLIGEAEIVDLSPTN